MRNAIGVLFFLPSTSAGTTMLHARLIYASSEQLAQLLMFMAICATVSLVLHVRAFAWRCLTLLLIVCTCAKVLLVDGVELGAICSLFALAGCASSMISL